MTINTPHGDYTAAIVEFGEAANHIEQAVCEAIEHMNRDT